MVHLERWCRWLWLHLRSIISRRVVDLEMDEELQFHIDQQIDQNMAAGMNAKQARAAALSAIGGLERRREECRDARGVGFIDDFLHDIRYSIRDLWKHPGFAFVTLLTLALGIGANSTLFPWLDQFLFRPLPYADPDRLVRVFRTSPESNNWPHSVPDFLDYRMKNEVFQHLAAFDWNSFTLSTPGQPAERIQGMTVSADFFSVLGIAPELGQVFTDNDDKGGAEPTIVLSDSFWTARFGRDSGIIGRTFRWNGRDTRIVGVMPRSFESPLLYGKVDAWAPFAFTDHQRQDRGTHYLNLVGRLKKGVPLQQANQGIAALAGQLRREHGEANRGEGVSLVDFKTSIIGDSERRISWFTFVLTIFVLIIACINLATLQLARMTARGRDLALRVALGGGRSRLIRQSFTETVLIALMGGALGIPMAMATAEFIAHHAFIELPAARLPFDYRFFLFGFGSSLFAGIMFGVLPAWIASRTNLDALLKDNSRTATASKSEGRLRYALIVTELAFALVLLGGTGLFVRGLGQMVYREPGWRVDGVLIGRVTLTGPNYQRARQQIQYLTDFQRRLSTLPGVESASVSMSPPTSIFYSSSDVIIEGRAEMSFLVSNEAVSPRYFETLGIPLKEGRDFTSNDTFGRPLVIVINAATARRYWPNESPVGKRIAFAEDPQRRWMEIVGVASNVEFPSALMKPGTDLALYRPIMQSPIRDASLEVRTATSPEALIPAVRAVAAEIDKDQPVFNLQTGRSLIAQNVEGFDVAGTVLSAFSILGLILAAIGIFGVISYSVNQRTNEVGIRIALGARRDNVLWLILGQGVEIIAAGVLVGLVGTFGTARLLYLAMPTLPSVNVMTVLATAGILVVVALLACYVPARWATKIDPVVALRHE